MTKNPNPNIPFYPGSGKDAEQLRGFLLRVAEKHKLRHAGKLSLGKAIRWVLVAAMEAEVEAKAETTE